MSITFDGNTVFKNALSYKEAISMGHKTTFVGIVCGMITDPYIVVYNRENYILLNLVGCGFVDPEIVHMKFLPVALKVSVDHDNL